MKISASCIPLVIENANIISVPLIRQRNVSEKEDLKQYPKY